MIFSKSNLIIYIPMRSNFNELIEGYTVTNTSVVMSTDVDGTADMAGDFGNNTQAYSLSLINAVGVAIANQMNSDVGTTIFLNALVNENPATLGSTLLSQWGASAGQENFWLLLGRNANVQHLFVADGANVSNIRCTEPLPSVWSSYMWIIKKKPSFNQLDAELYYNNTQNTQSRPDTEYLALTSTSPAFLIGRRTDHLADRYFNGKMNNLQIHKKVLTPQEQFFANKFRNKKRVVS
jgi:hypothetical protein